MANVPPNQESVDASQTSSVPHRIGMNGSRQQSSILMTHAASGVQSEQQSPSSSVSIGGLNFGSRTAEQSRIFADNISTAFQEIRPLLEQARAVGETGGRSL